MKFLAVFAAIVAVAVGFPTVPTWTANELAEAIQNPNTNPAYIPYLEQALNDLMAAMFAGEQQTSIAVELPALDTTSWTLAELDAAISNPNTDPALVPYLIQALNQYMDALFAGQQLETIAVATPVGLIPVAPPTPVVVAEPESPAPAPGVVAEPQSPASSPLVQIIVNVNAQEQQVVAPVPSPAVVPPTPVIVPEVPQPVIIVDQSPEPVNVVEQAPEPVVVVEAAPEPVVVVDTVPEPVVVVDTAPEPVVVVETAPEPEPVILVPDFNPIDVIAITAPEVNPVDIISPIAVQPVGAAEVGPMV